MERKHFSFQYLKNVVAFTVHNSRVHDIMAIIFLCSGSQQTRELRQYIDHLACNSAYCSIGTSNQEEGWYFRLWQVTAKIEVCPGLKLREYCSYCNSSISDKAVFNDSRQPLALRNILGIRPLSPMFSWNSLWNLQLYAEYASSLIPVS